MELKIGMKYRANSLAYGTRLESTQNASALTTVYYSEEVIHPNSVLTYYGIFNPMQDHCFMSDDGVTRFVIEDEEIVKKFVKVNE